ncbi:MAG: bifunctional 5,10-methylenetetrahydrofolate dehydrogenase/5,10-methenyltetrahydrofolate cyclohydrolase [Candidatus Falkowbacteria bacterium]
MELINGKAIAEKIKNQVVAEISTLGTARPNLAIILVGEREDSKIYVTLKEKQAREVGIDTHVYRCPENISQQELLDTVTFLNQDELIDGILIQLPLPEALDTDKIIATIDPKKDIDGFQPQNLEIFLQTCQSLVEPPLIGVIREIISHENITIADKNAVALVNSDLLGKVIGHFFDCAGAKVNILHGDEIDLIAQVSQADILVSALGKPGFITADMLKPGVVVIDIGITRLPDNSVVGDVDATSVANHRGRLTPVPGGVGPITIAMAFKNTLTLYKQRHQ